MAGWDFSKADYEGNTALCVDLQLPGMPITTLGLKAIDAHVNETGVTTLLLDGGQLDYEYGPAKSNSSEFVAAESKMSSSFAPSAADYLGVYSFNINNNIVPGSKPRIPMHIRTGQQSIGTPADRKRYRQVELHGQGTCWVRVYVDRVFIHEGSVTLSENPSKSRRLGIPIGTRGYTIDIEIAGDANLRAVEYECESMNGDS